MEDMKQVGEAGPQNEVPEVSPEEEVYESGSQVEEVEDFGFLKMMGSELPGEELIKEVLMYSSKYTYSACTTDHRAHYILDKVVELFERDYSLMLVENDNAKLSYFYPARIPFVINEKGDEASNEPSKASQKELTDLLDSAYRARCRERFPVPVILYQGKTICRSATLAGVGEILARSILDTLSGGRRRPAPNEQRIEEILAEEGEHIDCSSYFPLVDKLQIADIAYLKKLNVSTIFDLMVEQRKHKLRIPITSSEKAEANDKYLNLFKIISIPFPGCEFFRKFHDQNFSIEGLYFDWTEPMCDAELNVSGKDLDLEINWSEYKKWDLIQMTQNYIKFILKHFENGDSGILIHCISGWDRTPLFVSLLRMSLWADGLIHKSLTVTEMLFFTLAYDWMLFGHHLPDRLEKSEDILLYCFAILKHLVDDSFSIGPKMETNGSGTSDLSRNPFGEGDVAPESKNADSADCYEIDLQCASSMLSETESYFTSESIVGSGPPSVSSCDAASPASMEVGEDSLKRASPIDFPEPSPSKRRVGSNLSCDNWQIISPTGSFRGSDSLNYSPRSSQNSQTISRRETRLWNIRRMFYRCYYHSINSEHVGYVTNKLGILKNIFHNLSELIQFEPRQPENP